MSVQNDEKILLQSVRSKRAFRIVYLPTYVCSVVFSVGLSALYTYLFYRANPDALEEMIDACFVSSFAFFALCLFGPLVILAHVLVHRRLRQQSITLTEERLLCTCGKKKSLNVPLRSVKHLSIDSEMFEKISFIYAGKKRIIWFIENRQELFEAITDQKKALAEQEARGTVE